MILNLSDLSDEPLHAQISRQLRARILAHELVGEDALPSIRAMSRENRVSVITVQRSYDDLEREGLIRSRRGKGFYVMPIPDERKQKMAEERFEAAVRKVVESGFAEGLDDERIRAVLARVLEEKKEEPRE